VHQILKSLKPSGETLFMYLNNLRRNGATETKQELFEKNPEITKEKTEVSEKNR
jgi:hypothetical protein